jgi:hypothetical protein
MMLAILEGLRVEQALEIGQIPDGYLLGYISPWLSRVRNPNNRGQGNLVDKEPPGGEGGSSPIKH